MPTDSPEVPSSVKSSTSSESRFAKQWHYRPPVPLATSPLFQAPPNLPSMVRWVATRWFVLGENVLLVLLAVITWNFFQPEFEKARTLE